VRRTSTPAIGKFPADSNRVSNSAVAAVTGAANASLRLTGDRLRVRTTIKSLACAKRRFLPLFPPN
jgi:hypothetical protein